jgi:hypothetical protein
MGDQDFLYALNSGTPVGDDRGEYRVVMAVETDVPMEVPLLWAALFKDSDEVTVMRRRILDEGTENEAVKYPMPAWHTSIEAGLANLAARRAWILDHVHPSLHPFIDVFEEKMRRCGYSHVQMDFYAFYFWVHGDVDHVRNMVRSALLALESSDGWANWCDYPHLLSTYHLYGMNFMFCESLGGVKLGWFRVGPDNRIVPEGSPGRVLVVGYPGDKEEEEDLPLFFKVCAANDAAAVRSLLQSGEDPNYCDDLPRASGVPALLLACVQGSAAVVRVLLDAGADPNMTSDEGSFALALAAEEGHTEIVDMLIKAGADVNKKARGMNALLLATIYKRFDIQEMLLKAGAGAPDKEG